MGGENGELSTFQVSNDLQTRLRWTTSLADVYDLAGLQKKLTETLLRIIQLDDDNLAACKRLS